MSVVNRIMLAGSILVLIIASLTKYNTSILLLLSQETRQSYVTTAMRLSVCLSVRIITQIRTNGFG